MVMGSGLRQPPAGVGLARVGLVRPTVPATGASASGNLAISGGQGLGSASLVPPNAVAGEIGPSVSIRPVQREQGARHGVERRFSRMWTSFAGQDAVGALGDRSIAQMQERIFTEEELVSLILEKSQQAPRPSPDMKKVELAYKLLASENSRNLVGRMEGHKEMVGGAGSVHHHVATLFRELIRYAQSYGDVDYPVVFYVGDRRYQITRQDDGLLQHTQNPLTGQPIADARNYLLEDDAGRSLDLNELTIGLVDRGLHPQDPGIAFDMFPLLYGSRVREFELGLRGIAEEIWAGNAANFAASFKSRFRDGWGARLKTEARDFSAASRDIADLLLRNSATGSFVDWLVDARMVNRSNKDRVSEFRGKWQREEASLRRYLGRLPGTHPLLTEESGVPAPYLSLVQEAVARARAAGIAADFFYAPSEDLVLENLFTDSSLPTAFRQWALERRWLNHFYRDADAGEGEDRFEDALRGISKGDDLAGAATAFRHRLSERAGEFSSAGYLTREGYRQLRDYLIGLHDSDPDSLQYFLSSNDSSDSDALFGGRDYGSEEFVDYHLMKMALQPRGLEGFFDSWQERYRDAGMAEIFQNHLRQP